MPGTAAADEVILTKQEGPHALRRLIALGQQEPLVVVACLILLATIVSAILAPLIAPYGPDDINPLLRFEGVGTPGHLLGTDDLGRDILSRLIWGARISLLAGILPAVAAVAVGTAIGIVAGYIGGIIDAVIMRVVDVLLAFPFLLLAVALVGSLGPSLINAMVAVVVATVPVIVRLIRGQVMALKEMPFVDAARLLGYRHVRIMFSELLPSLTAIVVTVMTIQIPVMILATAALSFLGLGVQPPTADWGSMVSGGLPDMTVAPHVVLVPSLTISLVALCFGIIGDTLQRRLNPRGGELMTIRPITTAETSLLEVQRLSVEFPGSQGRRLRAVQDVSFTVRPGEVVGLVGESGSGKTVTSLAIMGLLRLPALITSGSVLFEGSNLRALSPRALRERRGRDLAMIFQNPTTSLNPVFTIGRQIVETIQAHEHCSAAKGRQRAVEMLGLVGIPDPARRLRQFPHQFSGGMCQRIMIAMALCTRPRLLIADEPTTALDVTTQAQVLDLLRTINQQLGTSILLITHNLGVVAELCHRTLVMYAGEIVEQAPTMELFDRPLHPYTRGLLQCVPDLESTEPLQPLAGAPPDPTRQRQGCPFVTRCAYRLQDCSSVAPALIPVEPQHSARCLLYREEHYG